VARAIFSDLLQPGVDLFREPHLMGITANIDRSTDPAHGFRQPGANHLDAPKGKDKLAFVDPLFYRGMMWGRCSRFIQGAACEYRSSV